MLTTQIKKAVFGKRLLFALFVLQVFLFCGCSFINKNLLYDKDALRERVSAFWQARVLHDWIKCYNYEMVAKQKRLTLSQYFKKQGAIIYKSAKVGKVKIFPKKKEAVAEIEIEYVLPQLFPNKPIKGKIKDKWVYLEDNWYHYRKDLLKTINKIF